MKETGSKQARLYRYDLPMDSGVILRDRRLARREGWMITLSDGEKRGTGEVAPLPEFSKETAQEAGEQLQGLAELWLAGNPVCYDGVSPSAAFGFSMALAELEGALPEQGNYNVAPLCSGDPDDLVARLAVMPGEKVAKIKVGMYEAIRDGMVANMFLEAIPELTIRLDANRQWTPAKAAQFAKYVNPAFRERIAFLEEPCQTPAQSLEFSAQTGIAIAWDETLRDDGFELATETGLKAVVIKPTLTGSLDLVKKQVADARKLGLTVVISSSLESSFGLNQLARLAAWLTPETVPGLDTVDLFATQLETPWPGCNLPMLSMDELETVWQG